MKRQAFIAGVAAAPFLAEAALADTPTLKSAAAAAGIIYGANARDFALISQYPELASLMAQQCALVESGQNFYWSRTQPNDPASFEFADTDAWMAWATGHGFKCAECHLVWHDANPKWVKSYVNAQNASDVITNHVSTLVGRYAGKMYSWVVVNEAIKISDGRPDGLRDTVWLRNVGPEYLDVAFRAAAKADPQAILLYNDGGFEYDDTPSSPAHRRAILDLLRGMLSRGVPVHALGVESHLSGKSVGFSAPGFAGFLNEVSAMGLKIFISELDLADGKFASGNDDAARDALTAKGYGGYLGTALANKSVTTVINWSLADKYSWLNKWNPSGVNAKSGVRMRGLPFGFDLEPTPVFDTMMDAFKSAPKR
jgi:endo-1,4-beta-xylanase